VRRKLLIFTVVIAAMLGLDQGTKIWVRASLAPPQSERTSYRTSRARAGLDPWCQLSKQQIRVIDGFFDLCYSENTGVAFGLGKRVPPAVWVAIGVVALGLILMFLRQAHPEALSLIVALALVGGGALGNIADRIAFGYVTDFVVWRWHDRVWPTFNVADASLVAGVILMFLTMRGTAKEAADAERPSAGKLSRKK
jgi:lipoprotein signal peptidase